MFFLYMCLFLSLREIQVSKLYFLFVLLKTIFYLYILTNKHSSFATHNILSFILLTKDSHVWHVLFWRIMCETLIEFIQHMLLFVAYLFSSIIFDRKYLIMFLQTEAVDFLFFLNNETYFSKMGQFRYFYTVIKSNFSTFLKKNIFYYSLLLNKR